MLNLFPKSYLISRLSVNIEGENKLSQPIPCLEFSDFIDMEMGQMNEVVDPTPVVLEPI